MPNAKGERMGGRQKGSRNKITEEIQAKLARLKCDPLEGMATIAKDPTATLELRGRMYAELAQYVAPKRRAVEHSGVNGEAIQMIISRDDEGL